MWPDQELNSDLSANLMTQSYAKIVTVTYLNIFNQSLQNNNLEYSINKKINPFVFWKFAKT